MMKKRRTRTEGENKSNGNGRSEQESDDGTEECRWSRKWNRSVEGADAE
jgi:hypothetical protein